VMLFGEVGGRFEGACTITGAAEAESRRLVGALPANYVFHGSGLSCTVRKQATAGLLQVQFVRNGRSIKEASTRSPFGEVSLSVSGLR
jgi:hypothetical protein